METDYCKTDVVPGEYFILATDGVYEFANSKFISETIAKYSDDLDNAAKLIAQKSLSRGSTDNLTIQIIRIEKLPDAKLEDMIGAGHTLPAPPILDEGEVFEGYKILRQIHANHRSHIYLVRHLASGEKLALKIPSIDLRENEIYLQRFMMEEWIARRISNAHVLATGKQNFKRNFAYEIFEYVEGQTLTQWMIDNPEPDLETVRLIIEQIARGLRAFHRKEMIHQDLRPQNIMIDTEGIVKIIDFGSAKIAGALETDPNLDDKEILGTFQYSAPEYFIGEESSRKSDFFSLGVIAYQMLTGKLPNGTQVSKIRDRKGMRKLRYINADRANKQIPEWVDGALQKATQPGPLKRYDTLSEFLTDFRTPHKRFLNDRQTPFAEKNPVILWQIISLCLAIIVIFLLAI